MKFTVILTFAILLRSRCHGESVFELTFKILHQEPPPPPSTRCSNIVTGWIEQKLDHFNETDTRTWYMRYMANDQYFKAGGPIFIFVGGEHAISSGYLTGGHMHDMAKEHRGYLYRTEHRFYGRSYPTSDLQTENLKYLNVSQALADLAHFIRTIKSNRTDLNDSKVILVGGSYAGSMVIWFKRLYPDLIVGAWASSAPVLAKVNFIEYKEVVGRSIKQVGGDACYNRIQRGFAGLEKMMTDKRAGEVKKLLKICDNFDETNKLDLWSLFASISAIFSGIVQTHTDDKIQNVCQFIMKGDDDINGLTNFILFHLGVYSKHDCHNFSYKSIISTLKTTINREDKYMRQWRFQTCNEFGWFPSSDSKNQPFGSTFPEALSIAICRDAYGHQFTNETIYKNVNDTNEFFGGLNPEVENVYITHGELDPWHAMGITEKYRATVIPLHSHCKDLYSIRSTDSAELKASKEKIAKLVRLWVKG